MSPLSRRTFLGTSGAISALALIGACSSGQGGGSPVSTSSGGQAVLPTFAARQLAAPDLASDNVDVSPGYLTYPSSPEAIFDSPPGSGGSVRALTYTYDPVAPELGGNAYWQALNAALGVDLTIAYTPDAEYQARFATTIAGDDIPDLMAIKGNQQQLPALLAAKFTDLTDLLAGDAALDYPNLAALPTASWLGASYGGRLWGVPVPRSLIGGVIYTRADILEQHGLSLQPSSLEEFVEMAEALTDEGAGRWAFGQTPFGTMLEANGLANGWTVDDAGSFTHNSTRPEYEQALADAIDLKSRGVVHPDGDAAQNTQRNEWMMGGTTAFQFGGYAGWGKFYVQGAGIDGFRLTGMHAPTRDGSGTPVRSAGSPASSFTAIGQQDDPERVTELLRILDWLNAPFGSAEYLSRKYGTEGVTFDFDGADPVLTSAGTNQTTLPVRYIAEPSPVIYEPKNEQAVRDQFDFQELALPYTVVNPTVGLYSETSVSSGAGPAQVLNDVQTEILLGNQPVTAWGPAVEAYMQAAGSTIQAEYEEAWAELNG